MRVFCDLDIDSLLCSVAVLGRGRGASASSLFVQAPQIFNRPLP